MPNTISTQCTQTARALVVPDTEWAQALPAPKPTSRGLLSTRSSSLAQRGMVTAEYAVGILAAVGFAVVLLNILRDDPFLSKMTKIVANLIGKLGSQI